MISERAFRMNFEEFQNQSRFYVVGALEPGEVKEFERDFWQSEMITVVHLASLINALHAYHLAISCPF